MKGRGQKGIVMAIQGDVRMFALYIFLKETANKESRVSLGCVTPDEGGTM